MNVFDALLDNPELLRSAKVGTDGYCVTLDTSQSCELLECSRQNLSYLIKQGQLQPIREEVKGSLFRKGDILRKMQD